MGLLDSLIHAATGGGAAPAAPASNSIESSILAHVMGMMGGQGGGGLGALIQKLTAGGLGSQVQSWVGTGPNQPVTPTQVQQAMGPGAIEQLAAKLGIPVSVVAGHLSQILPQLVNHLTPNGTVPQPSLVQSAIGLLKGKLFGH